MQRLVALAAEPELIADRFELGALIGEGGMGIVYEAWDRRDQRLVALKLVRNVDEQTDLATIARFEREARALATLSHPSIVGYIAHGSTAADERYLAMERLAGVTLATRLGAGPLPLLDALHVGDAVASALEAAHALALVHRDIKPSNVFLEAGDPRRAKLLDFGLARSKEAPAVTRAGALVGTPGYMAPEQARGATTPDARSDLFALGAVLYECLTGRAPFTGADTEAVLVKLLVEQPARVSELVPAAPPQLDALIARLLAKEPARRPADAAEVVRELTAVLAAAGSDTPLVDAATSTTEPGSLIAGKYRVVRTLGSGGMGIVVLARHETLDRNVAIKLLRGNDDEQSGGVARLVREARAVSRLESEHVARVMDVGTLDDGAPFIVMEYLSGKDLAQLLRDEKRLPVDVVVSYLLQACSALAEAHALGIVHRDLKPSNLFLTTRRDGSALVKVLDFGISKLAPSSDAAHEPRPGEATITAPDAILGSPLYMSPEQLQSPKHVDARTDIWSLGVVLHELLTGRPPFGADTFMAIGAQIAAGTPANLRDRCPEAPDGLARLVLRCLEKDPAQRFQNIEQLAQALAPFAPEGSRHTIARLTPGSNVHPASKDAAASPPPWRRAEILLAIAATVALGSALFAAWSSPGVTNGATPVTASSSPALTPSATPLAEPAPSASSAAALPAASPPAAASASPSTALPSAPAAVPSAPPAKTSAARAAQGGSSSEPKRRVPAASVGASKPSIATSSAPQPSAPQLSAPQPPPSKPAASSTSKPAPLGTADPMNPALLDR